MNIELLDEDRAALRAVYLFATEALRLRAVAPSQNIITIALGLAILDRLTESDEEETS